MLSHETLGGMSPFAARHLRRLGRDAAVAGVDATDYQLSATARSFVPFYAQRISHNIVMHGARNALGRIKRLRHDMCAPPPAPREPAWPRGRRRLLISRDSPLRSSGLF